MLQMAFQSPRTGVLQCGAGHCKLACIKAGCLLSCSHVRPDRCIWSLQTCTRAQLKQLLTAIHEATPPGMIADLYVCNSCDSWVLGLQARC